MSVGWGTCVPVWTSPMGVDSRCGCGSVTSDHRNWRNGTMRQPRHPLYVSCYPYLYMDIMVSEWWKEFIHACKVIMTQPIGGSESMRTAMR